MRKLLPLLLLAATPAWAHPPVTSPSLTFLPPEGQVVDLLAQDPGVRRASAMLTAAQAEARGREAGPHEFTLHGEYVSRATNLEGRLDEWVAGVSRGIRLPGKAEADSKIGASGIAVAENGFGDARHQAAITLKTLWIAWLVAEGDAVQAQAEAAAHERQLSATQRARQLGQSATLQVEQVEAALAQARLLAAQAVQARLDARMTLQRSFPALTLPVSPPAMPEPQAPPGSWDEWREAVLEDNHEIKMARSEAERREWLARRARLDRFADPTLDLRTFQERSGHETGFGVGFSMPIGGALRSATADQTAAEAAAATVAARKVQRDVEIVADRDVIQAQQGLEAWRQASIAAKASAAMTARMQRAYELGDQGLTELLIARRQDYDVRRNEARARAAAHSAILQLMIDSHRIWGLGDEG
ncbi:MAG TPA: TolC family protein [Rhizomicrobium sp.]|nr:TolC family protein [Rhizomicrobium sp.]